MAVYNVTGNTANPYNKNGNLLTVCYDVQGNQLGRSHAVSNNAIRSLLMAPDIPTGTQGLACDSLSQSIAQFYSGYMYFLDTSDGSAVKSNNINLGHGHTGQFAPTKTTGHEYPTLYVCGPGNRVDDIPYCFLLEIICETTTVQLNKIYAVPAVEGQTGTLLTCIDFENNLVYLVGASTYYDTADYMYISAWDMGEYELLEGATYSPTPQDGIYVLTEKVFEFQIPFVPEAQGCTFFDGLIAILSDRSGAANKYVQFVDVDSESVYLTFNSQMIGGELEGIGFLLNNETNKYDMIISTRTFEDSTYHTDYYRYQFI